MTNPDRLTHGLDFDGLTEFLGWHLPDCWSIEIGLAKRYAVVWAQDDTDRDSRIAVEDMYGCGDLSLPEQVLVAVNYAREQKGMEPVDWTDGDPEK